MNATLAQRLAQRGLDWLVPDWPVAPHVHAFVTTRSGGVSHGAYATMNLTGHTGDDPAAVAENQRQLAQWLPSPPVWLRQVHGADVAVLGTTRAPTAPTADAAVTPERGVVCAVQIADCLPVLFADRRGTVAGIAHAGWRGVAGGVLEATVAALETLGAPARELCAWLGPAIGPAAFEVGDEVRAAFIARDPVLASCFVATGEHKWLADLYAAARIRLSAAGVTAVSGGGFCTKSERDRFFSYRRERESGRMAALVWLGPDDAHV